MKNKKTILFIGLLILILAVAFFLRPTPSNSASSLPYQKPETCDEATVNGLKALDQGWDTYLNNLTHQSGPTSAVVDDAFDSVRTYRCWLESFCRSVQASAADPQGTANTGILKTRIEFSSKTIGTEPGCPDPEDMTLPPQWNDFLTSLKNGAQGFIMPVKQTFVPIPQCRAVSGVTESAALADQFYSLCLDGIQKRFRDDDKTTTPIVLLKLNAVMLDAANEKKTRALESKLLEINQKLSDMYTRVTLLTQYVSEFYNRIPCTLSYCQQK